MTFRRRVRAFGLVGALVLVVALVVSLGGAGAAPAREDSSGDLPYTTVRLNPVADTAINAWDASRNFSTDANLHVRSGDIASSLFQFDLSTIPNPQDVAVAQATLKVYTRSRSNNSALVAGLYGVNRSWDLSKVDWGRATVATNWTTAGCNGVPQDRAANPLSTANLAAPGGWASFDLTSIVQGWIDGSIPNHGVILKCIGGDSVEYTLVSSRSEDPSLRPVLQVLFATLPTPTPTMTATPTPMIPALQIAKTGPGPLHPGNDTLLDYQIVIRNTGTDVAHSIVITDILPLGTNFVSASHGGIYNAANAWINWQLDTLPVNASVTLSVRLNLASWIKDMGSISNIAQASATGVEMVEAHWETVVLPNVTPTPRVRKMYITNIFMHHVIP